MSSTSSIEFSESLSLTVALPNLLKIAATRIAMVRNGCRTGAVSMSHHEDFQKGTPPGAVLSFLG